MQSAYHMLSKMPEGKPIYKLDGSGKPNYAWAELSPTHQQNLFILTALSEGWNFAP